MSEYNKNSEKAIYGNEYSHELCDWFNNNGLPAIHAPDKLWPDWDIRIKLACFQRVGMRKIYQEPAIECKTCSVIKNTYIKIPLSLMDSHCDFVAIKFNKKEKIFFLPGLKKYFEKAKYKLFELEGKKYISWPQKNLTDFDESVEREEFIKLAKNKELHFICSRDRSIYYKSYKS